MRFARGVVGHVSVVVMLVVSVRMCVNHYLVGVLVRVALRQMEPDTEEHEPHGDEKPERETCSCSARTARTVPMKRAVEK
jgi:hypothetical protein